MAGVISRQHLRITFEDRRFFIEDLGSTNGTRVNGSEIRGTGKRPIEDGDDIDVAGALKMTFKI
jgi:pSer/pThr/pTyr-binding forkhead associated (FHA) protein